MRLLIRNELAVKQSGLCRICNAYTATLSRCVELQSENCKVRVVRNQYEGRGDNFTRGRAVGLDWDTAVERDITGYKLRGITMIFAKKSAGERVRENLNTASEIENDDALSDEYKAASRHGYRGLGNRGKLYLPNCWY